MLQFPFLFLFLCLSVSDAFVGPAFTVVVGPAFPVAKPVTTTRPTHTLQMIPKNDDKPPPLPNVPKTKPFVRVPSPIALSVSILFGILGASGAFTKGTVGTIELALGLIISLASFVLAIQVSNMYSLLTITELMS